MAIRNNRKMAPIVQCRIEGCMRQANRKGPVLCEVHYYRIRRNGTQNLPERNREPRRQSGGYVLVHAPDHPMSVPSMRPRAYEHRVVFYDAHGDGPFPCHWCGQSVGWADMHVDHVNSVRNDNRLSNLVSSCGPCNQSRSADKTMKAMRKLASPAITYQGVTKSRADWADTLGINSNALKWRLDNGWSLERALTEPRGKVGPVRALRKRRVSP